MITDIFSKDKTDLNLTKAMFRVMPTHTGKLYIDTIFFQYTGQPKENIYTYQQVKEMTSVFCVRKEKGNSGFSIYKTFQGLMTRLHEDVRNYKNSKR